MHLYLFLQNLGYIYMGSVLFSLLFGITSFRVSVGQGESAVQLPIRDINILVLTDVHSWVMGHGRHSSILNADYGHVLSFYEKLKVKCAEQGKDLFFVNNGDVVDGTGLSTYPPDKILPIVKMMPYDALTIGNHELYHEVSVRYMQESSYFDFWDGRYLTSNTVDAATNNPLGNRFAFLRGLQTGSTILVFGFLYNMLNNCAITNVLKVQDVVESEWFIDVLSGINGDFHAIIVLAHMDAEDELIRVILDKIRIICGDRMPVQFLTGHSHLRKYNVTDGFSSSFEAGHYLDTVGYISFDLPTSNSTGMIFHHEFIDANVVLMTNLLGESSLMTTNGKALSQLINQTETELGILNVIGCNVPNTYYLKHSIDKSDSLWGLFLNEIVPKYLFTDEQNGNELFIANSGAWRYDLYKGNVTVNDMISVSPYNDTLCVIGEDILGSDFLQAFGVPNFVNSTKFGELPQFAVAGIVEPNETYKVYSITFDCDLVSQKLSQYSNRSFVPMVLESPTTTTLWHSFITKQWTCPEPKKNWKKVLEDFFSEFTVLKIIAFVLTFFIIIIYGWMFICRRDKRRVTGLDDLSFFDESIVGEISTDDEDIQDNPQSKLAKEPKVRGTLYHSVKDQEFV